MTLSHEAAAVASPDELPAATWSRRSSSWRRASIRRMTSRDEIKKFVRERLSAYAYPRRIEFVPDLPKTLTG